MRTWRWTARGLCCLALLGELGCAPPGGQDAAERMLDRMDLEARVGQLVVVPLPGAGRAPDSAALAPVRHWLQRGVAGGVEVRGGDAVRIAEALRSLRAAHPVPPLVLAQLTEGRTVAGGPDFPTAAAIAGMVPPEEAHAAGRAMAEAARAVGIDLAIVSTAPTNGREPLPLPARDPERAARGIAEIVRGARDAGVLVGVRTLWEADAGAAGLDWSRARLEAFELPWIVAARHAGADAVQLGETRVPALTGDSLPLPLSPAAVQGMLRRDLGWEGVVVADLSPGGALERGRGAAEAAVLAVAAGADLLTGVRDPERVTAAVAEAVRSGRLSRHRVEEAAERVLALKARSRSLPAPAPPDSVLLRLRDPAALELAERLAARLTVRLPGPDGTGVLPPLDSGVLIATPVGRGRVLAGLLAQRLPSVRHLPLNLTADSALVARALADEARGTATVIAASFPVAEGPSLAEVAALGDGAPGVVPVLFRPWSLDALARGGPAVVSWGVGPTSQHAAARLLLGQAPSPPLPPGLAWPPARTLRPVPAAAVGMDAAALQRVDRVLTEAVEQEVFTGAALAVGRRGGLVRVRGYGRSGPEAGSAPVDPEQTVFDLASLTKVVGTTAAAMLLADAGVLPLDAPVSRYLPEWRGGDKERVTVRHLLTHTSGLPSGLWLYGSARSPAQALRQVVAQPLRRPPGGEAEYSDLGMILLAEVVERAAGTPLDRLLARELFAPLGMSSTQFQPPSALLERIVPTTARATEREFALRGVVHDANAFRLGGVTGHAGIFSTARDLAVFAQTLLNGGAYGTVRVLSPEVVAAFTRRQPGADTRALGWDTPSARSSAGRFFSARAYGHTGYTGTSLWIDPEHDLFVVLLTNRTFPEASAGEMLRVRAAVHDAVAQAVTDARVERRPGSR